MLHSQGDTEVWDCCLVTGRHFFRTFNLHIDFSRINNPSFQGIFNCYMDRLSPASQTVLEHYLKRVGEIHMARNRCLPLSRYAKGNGHFCEKKLLSDSE